MRTLMLFLALIGVALVGLARTATPAFACTGPGPISTMLSSEVILEGRITSLEPTTSAIVRGNFEPAEMTFEVARGHLGTTAGETVTALAFIPGPFPVMCPQWSRDPAEVVGKYVVIGLLPPQEGDARLVADAWMLSYMGDNPAGVDYEDGVHLAEIIADSDPEAPLLTLDAPAAVCGKPLRLRGSRFAPGSYVVELLFGRALALVDVGADGSFERTVTFIDHGCRNALANGQLANFHVRALPRAQTGRFSEVAEIAALPMAGAVDRPHPAITVSPDPAGCGDELTIAGRDFEPREQVEVIVSGEWEYTSLQADEAGGFTLRRTVPAEACDNPFIRVQVRQGGFGDALPPWSSLAEVYVGRDNSSVGPPVAGTGLVIVATDAHIPWSDVVMVAILLMAFGGGTVAIIRSVRRR